MVELELELVIIHFDGKEAPCALTFCGCLIVTRCNIIMRDAAVLAAVSDRLFYPNLG
jgi:hypothetical protein